MSGGYSGFAGILGALVSAGNSSVSPLAGDAVFTGTADDVSQYTSITVFLHSDVGSAINGASLELSTDGITWLRKKQLTLLSDASQVHSLLVVSQFFRVVYTNGSSAQSDLNIQTIYHAAKERSLTSGTQQVLGAHEDVTLVRSVTSPLVDINFGRILYISSVEKFGFNPSIGTSNAEPLTPDATLTWLQAATTVRVAAGNTNDTASGSGARQVIVEGLDQDWMEQTETIATAGTSASADTTITFIRINNAYIGEVGSYTDPTNAGAITIENSAGDTDLIHIEAGAGQSQHGAYSVPGDKTAVMIHFHAIWDSTKDGDIRIYQRRNADDVSVPVTGRRLVRLYIGVSGDFHREFEAWPQFPARTDVWIEAQANTSSAACSVEWDMYLVDD